MSIRQLLTMTALVVSGTAMATNTWWVAKEDANAADSLDSGRGSEALPFRTIQAALDNPSFEAGDVVKVKRGVYDEGGKFSNNVTNRVYVSKTAFLYGVEGRDVTHIVGKKDYSGTAGTWKNAAADAEHGVGVGSIRGICVTSDAANTEIHGFTIRDGATSSVQHANGSSYTSGGGVFMGATAYVVDCAISNNACCYGGATYGGVVIRSRIRNNWGEQPGCAFKNSTSFACVISDESDTYVNTSGNSVNCTYYRITGTPVLQGNAANATYNCLFSNINNGGEVGRSGSTIVDCWQTTDNSTQASYITMAPRLDDFRPRAGYGVETRGRTANRSFLANVPERFLKYDYYGNEIDWTAETMCAGAVQTTATPVTARVSFSGCGVEIDGKVVPDGAYFYGETYPKQYRVRPIEPNGSTFFSFTRTDDSTNFAYHLYLQPDGYTYILPRTNYVKQVFTAHFAAAEIWVSPTGSDATGDGSENNPYGTLQHAADSVTAAYTMVRAKKGDYTEGSYKLTDDVAYGDNVNYRVGYSKTSITPVLFRAEEGPSKTAIVGGANIGCVYAVKNTAFQGFTLRNGETYSKTSAGAGTSSALFHGAAFYNPNTSPYAQLLDSVITNCTAGFSLIYTGLTKRNRIIGCTTGSSVSTRGIRACDLVYGFNFDSFLNTGTSGYYLTVVGGNGVLFDASCSPYNCVVLGGKVERTSNSGDIGNYYWNCSSYANVKETSHKTNPLLADTTNGDFRPLAVSPVIGGGAAYGYNYIEGDINLKPFTFSAGGKPTAGCVQSGPYPTKAFFADTGTGLKLDGENAAGKGKVIEPDGSATFTLSCATDQTRFCNGYALDGVAHVFDTYPWNDEVTIDYSSMTNTIKALYSTNWYVNAAAAVGGNGFTVETAKQTLAGCFADCAVASGDRVNVLPGTYDTGDMAIPSATGTRARVTVPSGVTVASTGGAEVTVIKGASAPAATDEGYGCGTGAVQCVYLRENAKIDGFTLTGGRTLKTYLDKVTKDNDLYGAAVQGASYDNTYVDNCIITNNVGYRYTCYYTKVRRCLVRDNRATDGNGGGTGDCRLYHSLVTGNYGGGTMYMRGMYYSSAFGNMDSSGNLANDCWVDRDANYNCVFGCVGNYNSNPSLFCNCVLGNGKGNI